MSSYTDTVELAAGSSLRFYLDLKFGAVLWPTGPDYLRAESIEAKLEVWGHSL